MRPTSAVGPVPRRLLPLIALVALLGAAMLAASYGNPSIEGVAPDAAPTVNAVAPSRAEQPAQEPPDAPDQATGSGSGAAIAAGVLGAVCAVAAVLAAAALFLLGRRWRRPTRIRRVFGRSGTGDVGQLVRAAVDEGLQGLGESDADPRRAIIACWVRLERAAAEAGTPRAPGDTSTDLVSRLLAAHRVSADVLAPFAASYREARFAAHAVEAATRDQARAALRQLREELSMGVRG